jgi:hypothetical protein
MRVELQWGELNGAGGGKVNKKKAKPQTEKAAPLQSTQGPPKFSLTR